MNIRLALTEECEWRAPGEWCRGGVVCPDQIRPCPRCNGRGRTLTDLGREIIEFVRDYGSEE
jgi:hypothetical protein